MGLFKNLLGTTLDQFRIGRGKSGDKFIYANTADANKPALKFNDTLNKWELSNDGAEFLRIGVSNVALSEGMIVTETTDSQNRTGSGSSPTEVTQLQTTFTTFINEKVLLTFTGCAYPGGTETIRVYYQIDSDGWVRMVRTGDTTSYPQNISWGSVATVSTAGTHTLKLAIDNENGGGWTLNGVGITSRLAVTQYRGGYIQPENIPILEYNSSSQIHLHASPGASSQLRAMLNDGKIYSATAPLTIDLTVSGRGGLDSGSEASSTWYYAYLVPNSAGDGLSALCSVNDPSTGPTGYSTWRYVGAFRNNGSSNIVDFVQQGNTFQYKEWVSVFGSTLAPDSSPASISLATQVPVTANKIMHMLVLHCQDGRAAELHIQAVSGSNHSMLDGGTFGYVTGSNTSGQFETPIITSQTVWRSLLRTGGSGNIDWAEMLATGWVDGYLSEKNSQVQSKYIPDTALPQLTYSSASAINVAAVPGQNATVLLTLQDGKQRAFTGTLAWSFSNGVADLGLDEGSEASSTWYYLYAVPKSGADDFLTVRASDNAPTTGPTGYSNWRYIGAFRNDGSSNIYKFVQVGNDFHYTEQWHIYDGNGSGYIENETAYAEVSAATQTPATAKRIFMRVYIDLNAENPQAYWAVFWSTDGVGASAVVNPRGDTSVSQNAIDHFWIAMDSNRSIWRKRSRQQGSNNIGWIGYAVLAYTDAWLLTPQSAGAGAPGKHAASHQHGGSDEVATGTPAANVIPKASSGGKLDSWITADAAAGTASLRTLGSTSTTACAGNDSRLSDARTPTSHASSHNAGGGDALTIDAAAGTGSLRTLGTSSTSACAGNDSRLSDARTPTAHATSHKNGGSDEVGTGTPAANAIPKADGSGTLNSWITTYLPPTTLASLGSVVTTGLPSGAQIYVTDVDGVYEFESSGSYTADGLGVIAGNNGGYWIGEVVGRWDDAFGDIAQGQATAALTYEAYRDTAYLIYCMQHNQDDTLHFRFQFPHRWKYDTNVILHIHFLPLADPASDQDVHFDGYYAWSKIGGTAVPALTGWTTFSVTQTISNGDVYKQKIKTLATITPPSEARESTFLLVYLRRNSGASDTYTTSKDHGTAQANVGLLGVDVHFRLNKVGTITDIPA
jgi:hypothetical protein